MAVLEIVDYGTLKAAVAAYLHRSDLTDQIPAFIALGVARINKNVKSVNTEKESSDTLTAGSESLALPSDFRSLRRVMCDGKPVQIVTAYRDGLYNSVSAGTPAEAVVMAGKLYFSPTPAADVTIDLTYYGKIPAFSASTDTHALLQSNPNIFVYAAMLEAMPFLQGDERMPLFVKLYEEEVASENALLNDALWSGGPLQIQSDMVTP